MNAYFRGSRVTILEFNGRNAWIQFADSDNSRRVPISDLTTEDDDTLLFLTDY